MDWYDREVDRLERDLADGLITDAQFRKELRYLNEDLRGAAEEAAEGAYRDVMGDW